MQNPRLDRRFIRYLDRRYVRRITLAPLTLVSAIIVATAAPIVLAISIAVDRYRHRRDLPRTRLALLLIGALIVEGTAIVISLLLWIVTGFGLLGSEQWRWHQHRRYLGLYTYVMLVLVTRVVGSAIEWRDHAEIESGPVVLIARHTSFFDALIPATVLSRRNRLLAHHVLTRGLRYAPCIDIVGHRFPNHFISRTPAGSRAAELAHVEALGATLDERSGAVIFPEGTFRTPERFERALRRIGRSDKALAGRAGQLDHVLPPRSAGTHALLMGAPQADLVVCSNTGFESFNTLRAIIDRPVSAQPIVIETWRIARAAIPSDADEFSLWLFERFVEIDQWVSDHRGGLPDEVVREPNESEC